jgi:hypothetical protein
MLVFPKNLISDFDDVTSKKNVISDSQKKMISDFDHLT